MKSILKKDRILVFVALLGLLASLAPLAARTKAEQSNRYYDYILDYSRLCDAEYNGREENRLSALRALQVCRAVGPFAERFKPQLTIRAKPCHGDMGGVLLLKLPLLSLDAGIPLRVKRFGIDFCHNNNYLLCCVKVIRINMDGRIRITKIISADHAKIVQTNG